MPPTIRERFKRDAIRFAGTVVAGMGLTGFLWSFAPTHNGRIEPVAWIQAAVNAVIASCALVLGIIVYRLKCPSCRAWIPNAAFKSALHTTEQRCPQCNVSFNEPMT
jgi:hypothetical protein